MCLPFFVVTKVRKDRNFKIVVFAFNYYILDLRKNVV